MLSEENEPAPTPPVDGSGDREKEVLQPTLRDNEAASDRVPEPERHDLTPH